MSCNLAKSDLIDYVYGELDESEVKKVEAELVQCEACRKEVDELKGMHNVLASVPQIEPINQIVFTQSPKKPFVAWLRDASVLLPRSFWGRLGFATAALSILLLVTGSIANLHIDYNNNQFSVSMGLFPQNTSSSQSAQDETVQAILAKIRQETPAIVKTLIDANTENQNEQLRHEVNAALAAFQQTINQKQQSTLELLDNSIEHWQETTNKKLNAQNSFLKNLVKNASFKKNN